MTGRVVRQPLFRRCERQILPVLAEALAPARRLGVPVRLVYLIGGTVADHILQTAIEADASKISKQIRKRRGILSFFKGDVIGPVAERLPETMELVVRA